MWFYKLIDVRFQVKTFLLLSYVYLICLLYMFTVICLLICLLNLRSSWLNHNIVNLILKVLIVLL